MVFGWWGTSPACSETRRHAPVLSALHTAHLAHDTWSTENFHHYLRTDIINLPWETSRMAKFTNYSIWLHALIGIHIFLGVQFDNVKLNRILWDSNFVVIEDNYVFFLSYFIAEFVDAFLKFNHSCYSIVVNLVCYNVALWLNRK